MSKYTCLNARVLVGNALPVYIGNRLPVYVGNPFHFYGVSRAFRFASVRYRPPCVSRQPAAGVAWGETAPLQPHGAATHTGRPG